MQSILKIEQVQAGMVGNITAEMLQQLQQMGIDGSTRYFGCGSFIASDSKRISLVEAERQLDLYLNRRSNDVSQQNADEKNSIL